MEQRTDELYKRLSFLGYCQFQIKNIVHEALDIVNNEETRFDERVVDALEKYEKLGYDYMLTYSK
ncbi:MAG TPA: hypothetical protein VN611_00435 [Patescibacteria group bacterium]|nr:hypothetical protein [Patescibacteria group bacterium]